MKVILFGATGMVGLGVLRECLLDAEVTAVLAVGRKAPSEQNPKLRALNLPDLFDYRNVESELTGYDACFFCLGVSAADVSAAEYVRFNHDLPLAAALTLSRLNPNMTFIYVSGQGTYSTENGRVMWARVKGRTENDLLKLPFKAAYQFRPGIIQPLNGATSKTGSYRIFYALTKPILPVLRRLLPDVIITTEQVGRAMLNSVKRGYPNKILEIRDIRALADHK